MRDQDRILAGSAPTSLLRNRIAECYIPTMGGPKKAKRISVADYLESQAVDHLPTMQRLRNIVSSTVPEAREHVSYGILCFTHHYLLVGIGATKDAVSFHTMNPRLVAAMKTELGDIDHAGATLHFSPTHPLPAKLLTTIIGRRADENEARAKSQSVPRNSTQHLAAALKAAAKASEVLPLFEHQHPKDNRPRAAIEAITAWATGTRTLGMAEVRNLSLAAHSAARDAASDAARFAARAAGHAVATWHVPSHAEGAYTYAAKAMEASLEQASRRS